MRIWVLAILSVACTSKHETSETKVELKVVPAAGSAQGKTATGSPEPTPEAACGTGDQEACAAIANDESRKPAEIAALLGKYCDGGSMAACTSLGAVKLGRDNDVAGGVALFTKACNGGNGAGCGNLGIVHHEGLAGTKDLPKALDYFQKGCALDSAKSCGNAGRMLGDGEGVTADVPAATMKLTKGCQLKDDESCRMLFNAARILARDEKRSPDNMKLAIDAFDMLCAGDNGAACGDAGYARELTTDGKDGAIAGLYEKGCKLDDGAACYQRGRFSHVEEAFERGCQLHDMQACRGVLDPLVASGHLGSSAFPLLEEACRLDDKPMCVAGCKAGDAYVCELLAGKYKVGDRFGTDDALAKRANRRAIELREKGCKANDAKSCFDLGFAYHQGELVKKDSAKSQALVEKACKLGALDACYDLAESKYKGLDRKKDEAGGVADYQDLCQRGYHTACGSLGFLYAQGEGGLAKDDAKAIEMFAQGCAEDAAWSCFEGGKRMIDKDRDGGIAKLKSACRWGDNRACEELGKQGITERKDPAHTTVFH